MLRLTFFKALNKQTVDATVTIAKLLLAYRPHDPLILNKLKDTYVKMSR